jgi:lipopolysaccharide export system protein LptA
VRFTIERIRTLVLAAGVVLLAALGAFLWVAKSKNLLSRRDLPQRLGVGIKGEADGYTYVHAFGAHDQYRIHASKEVELKNDRIELHDVQIDLFGEDGTRIDHIAGEEFEFDQKTGIATAQGPVEMLLSRPQPAAAKDPKTSPQTNIDRSRPPAPHADGASGQIDVKTSGVSFDRNSGLVTTAERVNFSMTEGYGSAMGASYNSQTGYLTLEQAVELTTQRGTDPVEIHAQHAEFDRNAQVCWLHAVAADYR